MIPVGDHASAGSEVTLPQLIRFSVLLKKGIDGSGEDVRYGGEFLLRDVARSQEI